jgi:formylglycine-generating enzyme required for sulfatase activity
MSLAVLDDFIRRYGDAPMYGPAARAKREELARLAVPPPQQPQQQQPSPSGAAPLTAERERELKAKDSFKECADCPEMVVVPAGVFTMGSPAAEKDRFDNEVRHAVTIGRPFAVGKFHVTIDQFAAFARETAQDMSSKSDCSWHSPGYDQEGSHPVVCVSWDDAMAYADWMARKTGKPYRLLSEAEFEYAARGRTSPGTYPRFWFGDNEKDLCRHANFNDRSRGSIACDDGYFFTSPAGHYKPNAFGLYDMAGNAWQWIADCWHDSYDGAPADGSAWTAGACKKGRVVRGGSFGDYPWALRAAYRGAKTASNEVGFRVARTLAP